MTVANELLTGRRWWGFSILASKRCYHQTHFRRFVETNSPATWLWSIVHSTCCEGWSLEDQWTYRFLQREYVQPNGCRRWAISTSAHELPLPHLGIQEKATIIQGFTHQSGRAWNCLQIWALWCSAWAVPCKRVHTGISLLPNLILSNCMMMFSCILQPPDKYWTSCKVLCFLRWHMLCLT